MGQEEEKKKKKKPKELLINARVATIYDNNILKNSDQYLERFMNGEDEGRFHIKTYDDLIIYSSLRMTGTFRLFGKQRSQISGEYSRRDYIVNPIKNWSYFGIGFRQYVPKRISFKFFYTYIPHFYVRHFRDELWVEYLGFENPLAFQPFEFEKDNFGFWIQKYFFKTTRIRLSINYARYFHNQYYTEHDSKNMLYGAQFFQPLTKKLRLEVGYQYITSDAKGYDAAVETPETSNGPDPTYVEDRFTLALLWKLPRIKKFYHQLDGRALFFRRYYTTDLPWQIDRLHAGRVDNNLRLYFNYRFSLNKYWQFKLHYNWLGRYSTTTAELNQEFVSNEKDYRQDIFGFEVSYAIRIR
jgi:hypothetical protein